MRRCSFCNQPGHNIKGCINIDLLIFEKNTLTARNNNLAVPARFQTYLENVYDINPYLCHALSVKRCHVLTRTRDKNIILKALYDYLFVLFKL